MEVKVVYFLTLAYLWKFAAASFVNHFDDVSQHTDLLLGWDRADAADYPLVIHARVLNRTGGRHVNTIELDIAAGLTQDSFLWEDLPFPLPFLPTATYELRVLRQQQADGVTSGPVVALSPPFTIVQQDEHDDSGWRTVINGTTSDPPKLTNPPDSDGRPSSSTAIAAGLVVPFVVGISVFVFLWMQRRRRKKREEQRKERAGLVID